jgi:hypothetical protein
VDISIVDDVTGNFPLNVFIDVTVVDERQTDGVFADYIVHREIMGWVKFVERLDG